MTPPEIVVVPFPHPGHLFPATQLCNQLATKNYKITIFYPSSSSPSSLSLHPLVRVIEFSLSDSVQFQRQLLDEILLDLISNYFNGRDPSSFPVCAIVDEMISWAMDPFVALRVPAVAFFTSSACSSALSHAMDKVDPEDLPTTPGKILAVPGLPEEMALTSSSLAARHGPPGGPHSRPPNGVRPRRGLAASDGVAALLFNTCGDLERPFLDYVARATAKPVWGVGPLLPARFKDGEVRSKRESSVSEKEVIEWLDSKPRSSVIYVSFGSLVNPTDDELAELAAGLEESNQPFIWVIQPNARRHDSAGRPIEGDGTAGGYYPADVASRVGTRGLIIRGWAPQLSILSHPSTGGYVCHCGWNSTVEALGCGVPMLTWPVRGDQHHNARLVTGLLRVGLAVREGDVAMRKVDVVRGIERLMMGDEGIKRRADSVRSILEGGFPKTSSDSIDSFLDFVSNK